MIIRIISALLISFSSVYAVAQTAKPVELADNAPDRHVVVRGDTLWGISGKFLKDPWRWPEVWRMNRDQIKNPHRIYPGQVIVLDRSGPSLRLETTKLELKVYEEKDRDAIPSIPHNIIQPFLSEPLVVETSEMMDESAKIIAIEENRVFIGAGDKFYVTGVKPKIKLWQVYRPAKPIIDPDTEETLGYEAFYLGSARVKMEGEPATLEAIIAKQEMGRGDRLMAASKPDIITYAPHAPSAKIEGRIVRLYDGVGETGRNYVVTLNRGKRDGIEIGHVLALYRTGRDVTYREGIDKEEYKLPDERYGLVFVFRTFDRVSYALVMNASRPVLPRDTVRAP
mgnify:CR=1 FL=1